jgi:hypothetical protein
LLLTGYWLNTTLFAIILAVFGLVAFTVLWPLTRRGEPAGETSETHEEPTRMEERTHRFRRA